MTGDGSLGRFSVVASLEVLGLRRRSGKVQAVADGDVYGIHLDAGRIILASSSNQALRLGLLLLRRGLVEPLYLQDVLRGRRSLAQRQALGRTVVVEGIVSRADLAASVEEQCVEVISRMLDFDTATFLFAGDDPLPTGLEIILLDTDRLLQAAAERQQDRAATRAMDLLLPPASVRLRLVVQLALISVHLTDAELLVALAVDRGTATLDGLAVTVPLDRLTLRRTVISLMERGYLIVASSPFGVDRH
jgi:Domain of unknown function (DUF4388)